MMAKKVQMSTVELVVKALTDKGYVVDDVELDKGVVTVAALAPHGSTLLDSFKQPEARKWLDSVPDMSIVDVEPELSVEEWEAQYGHVTDDDVAQALAPVVEEVEPVVVEEESIPGVNNLCLGCNVVLPNRKLRYCPECQKRVDAGEPRDSFGAFLSTPLVLQGIKVEFDPVTLEATIDLRNVEPVAEAAPETHEGETNMETKVEERACELCGELFAVGQLAPEGVCFHCLEMANAEDAQPEGFDYTLAHEDDLYSQYLSVRTEYFEDYPDLAMVFEAMTFRRFLVVRYQTDLPDGTSITRERKLLPSHVYQAKSTEAVCVVAYDTYRKEVRTFRVDKFRACRLGECAPEPKSKGVTLYPAAYEVRRATPMRVQNPANYLATGMWSSRPLPQVLVQ